MDACIPDVHLACSPNLMGPELQCNSKVIGGFSVD